MTLIRVLVPASPPSMIPLGGWPRERRNRSPSMCIGLMFRTRRVWPGQQAHFSERCVEPPQGPPELGAFAFSAPTTECHAADAGRCATNCRRAIDAPGLLALAGVFGTGKSGDLSWRPGKPTSYEAPAHGDAGSRVARRNQ